MKQVGREEISMTSLLPGSGNEVSFDQNSFIVSKTDLKGLLTYTNDVFVSISGFEERELIGKPHNVIRHNFMPRGIFRYLWKSLEAQREVFAYVVNRCKNGDHYWVLAHVTPTYDSDRKIIGYHSSRRVPNRKAVEKIVSIYTQMNEVEKKISNPGEAANASLDVLRSLLRKNDMRYDQFIYDLEKNS